MPSKLLITINSRAFEHSRIAVWPYVPELGDYTKVICFWNKEATSVATEIPLPEGFNRPVLVRARCGAYELDGGFPPIEFVLEPGEVNAKFRPVVGRYIAERAT